MRSHSESRPGRSGWAVLALPGLILWSGCAATLQPAGSSDGSQSAQGAPANASPDTASALVAGSADHLEFKGTITRPSDVGLFDLGTLAPGDHLTADVRRVSGDLDPVAAIFDSGNELIAVNDDRTPDGSDTNPLIDIVIRGKQDTYRLGVIAYPENPSTGGYDATVQIQRQVGVPPPRGEVVYLNWAGGQKVVVKNVGSFDLPPFSAADVGLPAAQTAAFKGRVRDIVADRYKGYNLTLVSSDDGAPPTTAHTTAYFGGDSRQAFAISEQIDTFNADPNDDLIVFTHSFEGVFDHVPTFEELAQALGNTIAHEVGHLLGLVHTADSNDLMDTSSTNDRLLQPQYFSTARVDKSVFPFGVQPEKDLLGWILGFVGP